MIRWNPLTVRVMMPFLNCIGCGNFYSVNLKNLSGKRLEEAVNDPYQTHKLADFDEQSFLAAADEAGWRKMTTPPSQSIIKKYDQTVYLFPDCAKQHETEMARRLV